MRVTPRRVGQHSQDIAIAHQQAVARGERLYRDPQTGWWVMTDFALTERGYCCGNGCRHCPYPIGDRPRVGRSGT